MAIYCLAEITCGATRCWKPLLHMGWAIKVAEPLMEWTPFHLLITSDRSGNEGGAFVESHPLRGACLPSS